MIRILSKLFIRTSHINQGLMYRSSILRKLTTPIKFAPFLTTGAVATLIGLESIFTFLSFASFISVLVFLKYCILNWDGSSSSIIPLIFGYYNLPSIDTLLDIRWWTLHIEYYNNILYPAAQAKLSA